MCLSWCSRPALQTGRGLTTVVVVPLCAAAESSDYSTRSAAIGSIAIARRAGSQIARSATTGVATGPPAARGDRAGSRRRAGARAAGPRGRRRRGRIAPIHERCERRGGARAVRRRRARRRAPCGSRSRAFAAPTANASAAYSPIVLSTSASAAERHEQRPRRADVGECVVEARAERLRFRDGHIRVDGGDGAADLRQHRGAASPDTRMCVRESCDQLSARSCCQNSSTRSARAVDSALTHCMSFTTPTISKRVVADRHRAAHGAARRPQWRASVSLTMATRGPSGVSRSSNSRPSTSRPPRVLK